MAKKCRKARGQYRAGLISLDLAGDGLTCPKVVAYKGLANLVPVMCKALSHDWVRRGPAQIVSSEPIGIIVGKTRADNKIRVRSSGFIMARAQMAQVYNYWVPHFPYHKALYVRRVLQ